MHAIRTGTVKPSNHAELVVRARDVLAHPERYEHNFMRDTFIHREEGWEVARIAVVAAGR